MLILLQQGVFMQGVTELGFPGMYDLRRHFQIKNMSSLNKILDGNPVAFTNVRHPFERLVSGYLHFLHLGQSMVVGKTFQQFVAQYLLPAAKASKDKQIYEKMNAHFKPTNSFCAFCNIKYTAISKGETFSEDKARILESLSLENHEVRLNTKGGNDIQNLTKAFFKNITENQRKAIEDLYKYDFNMFDYDPTLY